MLGTGWLMDLKYASMSDWTHPPPSSMMAMVPPVLVRAVGHLYAEQRFGTFQGAGARGPIWMCGTRRRSLK
jgi:hypothetical protein